MRLGITHMGNIWVAVKAMAKRTNLDLIVPPPTSQRTLSLGVKHSPETVCLPFKIQLGNMIEALELGADHVVMPGGPGPCRFGYYHKLHEQILREMGYKFHMVTEDHGIIGIIKYLANGASRRQTIAALYFGLTKLKVLDEIERMVHQIRPVERDRGDATRVYKEALKALDDADNHRAMKQVKREYLQKLLSLPKTTLSPPLKVGLTGELFMVLDPFTNMDVEIELGNLGVEVKRSIFLYRDWANFNPLVYAFHLREKDKSHRAALPYLTRHVGGDGWQSVGEMVLHAKDWDGIVHLEPFTCVPEITARNIMPSVKEKPPVLNLIYDEHTGKAGMINRLEAFVDMLRMKKRNRVQV